MERSAGITLEKSCLLSFFTRLSFEKLEPENVGQFAIT